MNIQVSLICPVYKVAQYIPELMSSLLAGVNTEQVEIIFVDDCCPEQSINICEQFIAENLQAIKFKFEIIKQPINQGQAALALLTPMMQFLLSIGIRSAAM